MCLAKAVVGILSDDNHLGGVKGALVKCVEDQSGGREDCCASVFGANEFCESEEIVFLKLGSQALLPTLFYTYVHGSR